MAVIPSKPNTKLMWASQGNRAEPTSDKQLEGWVQEIPPHEMENWVQYKQDLAIKYLYQEGIPEWDSSFEYNTTSYVKYNGVIYKLAETAEVPNIGKQPNVSDTSWEIAFEPYGASSNSAEEIRKIKELEGYLSLYVSKANPVMNGIATAPEFQATANGGHTFQNTDTGMFLNANNEPEFRINNAPKAVVRNNPSLTASDNTLVTMAMLQEFKANMFNLQFPVGISIITQDPRNPAEYLGFGSWERDLEGRALVGVTTDVTSASPDWVKQVNREFGEYQHQLSIAELPKHSFVFKNLWAGSNPPDVVEIISRQDEGWAKDGVPDTLFKQRTQEIGGDQPHNIVQPSTTKFIFTRLS